MGDDAVEQSPLPNKLLVTHHVGVGISPQWEPQAAPAAPHAAAQATGEAAPAAAAPSPPQRVSFLGHPTTATVFYRDTDAMELLFHAGDKLPALRRARGMQKLVDLTGEESAVVEFYRLLFRVRVAPPSAAEPASSASAAALGDPHVLLLPGNRAAYKDDPRVALPRIVAACNWVVAQRPASTAGWHEAPLPAAFEPPAALQRTSLCTESGFVVPDSNFLQNLDPFKMLVLQ
jgi:hypothetical protein